MVITLEIWNPGNHELSWQLRASFRELLGQHVQQSNSTTTGEQQPRSGLSAAAPLHHCFFPNMANYTNTNGRPHASILNFTEQTRTHTYSSWPTLRHGAVLVPKGSSSVLPLVNSNKLGSQTCSEDVFCLFRRRSRRPSLLGYSSTSRRRAFPENKRLEKTLWYPFARTSPNINRPIVKRRPGEDARCRCWVDRSPRVSRHIVCLLLFLSQHHTERTKYRTLKNTK